MFLPHPRPRRALARTAVVATALVGLVVAGAGIASAHVTVSSQNATAGGFGTLVFSVPDESDTASTVKLRIQLPTKTPFTSVRTEPVPGWTATLTRTQLNPPATDDDGNQVTQAVSVVEFDADQGGGIAPGQFQQFRLSVGPLPEADSVAFSVIQTYSDGTEVAWIEPSIAGQPEPEHPAPVLQLTAASGDSGQPAASGTNGTQSSAAASSTSWPAWLALGLAVVALVIAGVGLLSARRRTVAP